MPDTKDKINSYRELDEFLNVRIHKVPTKTTKVKELLKEAGVFLKQRTVELEHIFDDFQLAGKTNHIELSAEVLPYWSALQKIQSVLNTTKFKEFLKDGLTFQTEAIDNLMTQLDVQNQFVDYVQTVFNAVKKSKFSPETIMACRESKECYNAIYAQPKELGHEFAFATLLSGIQKYRTAHNAEFFAKIELYVKSGHAEADFNKVNNRQRKRHDTIQALYDLNKELETNPSESHSKLEFMRKAFENRFDELFESVKIKGSGDNRDAVIEGKIGALEKSQSGVALQRRVDAFIRDASNPTIAYATVVTTNKNGYIAEGDQLITHANATSKAIKNVSLADVKTVHWHYMYPALLSEIEESSNDGRGRKFQTCFNANGLTDTQIETLNMLPVLAGVSTHANFSQFLGTEVCLIGGNVDNWNREKKLCRNMDELESLISKVTADALGIIGSARTNIDFNASNIPTMVVSSLSKLMSVVTRKFNPENWTDYFTEALGDNALKGLATLEAKGTTYTTQLEDSIYAMKGRLATSLKSEAHFQ